MDHQNQVCNTSHSPDGTIKRKRGRPRKTPNQIPAETASVPENCGWSPNVPPGFEEANGSQPQPVVSVNGNNISPMVGKGITGVIEADFEGCYLISICVGNSDTRLSGVIFKSGQYVPVLHENDLAPGVQRLRTNKMPLPANNGTHLVAPAIQRIRANKMPLPANNGTHLMPGIRRARTKKMPLPANNGTHLLPAIQRIRANKRPLPANYETHLTPGVQRTRTKTMPLPANNETREYHAVFSSNGTPASNQGTPAQSRQLSIRTIQASTPDPLEGRGTLVPVILQSDNLSYGASPAIEARRIATRPAHLAASYVGLADKPLDELVGGAKMMNGAPLSTETHGSGFYFNKMSGSDSSFTQNGGEDLSKPLFSVPIQTIHSDMPSVSGQMPARTGKMTELLLAMERQDFRDPKN